MSTNPSNDGGRVKQTRRRQRLSCVECTKRRQKCDRQTPCGLCTSRGVGHLCRWEPIVVRPTPQRPPVASVSTAGTIEALSARIAALEQTILRQQAAMSKTENGQQFLAQLGHSDIVTPSLEGIRTPSDASSSSDESNQAEGPHALIDSKMQAAAVALAQLSLAPRAEYVGGGTILCAIHRLGDVESYRLPFAPSTSMTALTTRFFPGIQSFLSPIRGLIAGIPPRHVVDELLTGFFAERNWEFEIPEYWMRNACQQIWNHLDRRCATSACTLAEGCPACREEINPHCLVLLFAMLSLAPGITSDQSITFFTHALSARRLGEDILLASPVYSTSESAVNGAVLSCIGASFLAAFLADRGRVSEAWKLTGCAMRHAQAMGLHRDPGWQKWESMGKEESELRMLGWWSLYCCDRIYSFILGRPMMASKGTFDVTLLPMEEHGDGSRNPYAAFGRALIKLCDMIGAGTDECLSIEYPSYSKCLEIDATVEAWLAELPDNLRWREHPPSPSDDSSLTQQRLMLAAYFLGGLMSLHRPYLMHPIPDSARTGQPQLLRCGKSRNASRERCIELAIELVRVLCSVADFDNSATSSLQNNFFYTYFVFDGAVALAGALSQTPPHPRAAECLELMDSAMRTLNDCVASAELAGGSNGEGVIAKRAIVVLEALRRAGGWGAPNPKKMQVPCSFERGPAEKAQGGYTQQEVHDAQLGAFPSSPDIFADFPIAPSGPSSPFVATPPAQQSQSQSPPAVSFLDSAVYTQPGMPPVFDQMAFAENGAAGAKLNAQSLMLPFDMLIDGGGFGSDWARIAGMDNWGGSFFV